MTVQPALAQTRPAPITKDSKAGHLLGQRRAWIGHDSELSRRDREAAPNLVGQIPPSRSLPRREQAPMSSGRGDGRAAPKATANISEEQDRGKRPSLSHVAQVKKPTAVPESHAIRVRCSQGRGLRQPAPSEPFRSASGAVSKPHSSACIKRDRCGPQEFDAFLLLLRRRAGWSVRQVPPPSPDLVRLRIPRLSRAAPQRAFPHPRPGRSFSTAVRGANRECVR